MFNVQCQKNILREVKKKHLKMKNFVIMIVQMQSVSLCVSEIRLLEWFPAFEVQKTFSVSRYTMPVSDVLKVGCDVPSRAFFSSVESGWREKLQVL